MRKNLVFLGESKISEAEGKQLFIKINEVKDSKEWALFIKHFFVIYLRQLLLLSGQNSYFPARENKIPLGFYGTN